MTAQRLVRGSKARIIASLCAVVFIVGLLVLFQKSQTELDNANKNYKICFEQQEGLATQLKVIVDYKTRLEKSLQAEKAEHKQTRTELESRINDEKTKRDKTSKEANNRFQSLQQHYKLLQTKHDDLQEKYDKLQQQNTEEIEKLDGKIKELSEQVKQSKTERDGTLESLKTQNLRLKVEKDKLAEEIKKINADYKKWESDINHLTKVNHQLKHELEANNKNKDPYKNGGTSPEETINAPQQTGDVDNNLLTITTNARKFAKQIEVATDVYEIRDNRGKSLGQQDTQQHIPQQQQQQQIVDTQQNGPNVVLQKPSSASKSTTTAKTSSASSQGNLNNARPLLLPTVTPSNANTNTSKYERSADFNMNSINVLPMPNNMIPHKKLPPGVVPVPMQELQKHDDSQGAKNDKTEDKNNNGIAEEINLALPNRYRNNIIESELANEINKEIKPEAKGAPPPVPIVHNEPEMNMGGDVNQQDNAAEVIDQPKNPLQDDLMDMNGGLGLGLGGGGGAGDGGVLEQVNVNDEFKHALKDPVVQLLENKKIKKQHIDTLLRNMNGNANLNGDTGAIRAPPGGGAMYENEGDYDKDGPKEDLQIEEADPEGEEDDDVDDYDGHLAARQKEPAVRN